jgi:hypothetical protein
MKKGINLDTISEEELQKLRICDLPLSIKGTWLENCIQQLYIELEAKGLIFKPECYLADEWLTPHNEPVIGIPFYLAHPTLIKLEKKMMLEAEGSTQPWCMKLLRHETGHAISYAYRLHKKKRWRELFGPSSQEYPETYRVRPHSKSYVRHLGGHYAQYHPDEDFVETFAVWLTPELDWETQYKGWPALRKLKYVDRIMSELKGKEPIMRKGRKYWQASTIKSTLIHFYKKKRHLGAEDFPDFHDMHLKKIFSVPSEGTQKLTLVSDIIKQYRKELLNSVSRLTGEKKYIIHDLTKTILQRCHTLKLVSDKSETLIIQRIAVYITTLVMNYLYTGWYRGDKKKMKK